MCVNDMFECQKASTNVVLPTSYTPLSLPMLQPAPDRNIPISSSTTSKTASIPIPTEVHRAFPETGSFGSYGKAGLAC
ncbi:hypothetical protein RB195_015060 [Necator americanus]|uniref:Uncharacterized protein n=1 Tax=Necator americanus TaxID=51031 RepID=A0ABR1E334_NECAM